MDIADAEVMGGWHPRKKLAQQDAASGCLSLFVGESLGRNDPSPQVYPDKQGSFEVPIYRRSQKLKRKPGGPMQLAGRVSPYTVDLHVMQ